MITRTRPTRRLFANLAMAVAIYGVGANVASGWVIAVGAAIGVMTLFAAATHRRSVRRVRAELLLPQRLDAGEHAVMVEIDVPGMLVGTAYLAFGADAAGADAAGAGSDAASSGAQAPRAALPARAGRHRLAVPGRFARGARQEVAVVLDVTDPLGTVTTTVTPARGTITVRPAPRVAGAAGATTVDPDAEVDASPRRARHGAMPDTELRRWRPGEPVRLVHWPTTLRTGELQARTTIEDARPRVTLGVPEGAWTREALDERCAAVRDEAERQTGLGADVEVAADGQVVPWGPQALDLLASLPPHAAAAPRPLAPTVVARR